MKIPPPCFSHLFLCRKIHCRNRHGSNRRGKKVTGLAFVETARLRGAGRQPYEGATLGSKSAKLGELGGCTGALGNPAAGGVPGTKKDGQANNMSSQYSLLSTTNDSRLRIHDLDSFSMVRGVILFIFFAATFLSV